MLVPRQEYSRELKVACMRELDSGKGVAEVARQYQLSPKRLEMWKGEWRAKGELAFPGKGARPQAGWIASALPYSSARSDSRP
jgi:transposase-like protein